MSSNDLNVRRLRLELPHDMSAHALRSRVEDALRIASMPTSLAHRFVLLRRLRLVLPREASAQSLALQLEREWRAIESLAQPMASASADAPVVWAAHEAEARLLLLQRWLDGRDTGAWFWQRLLPTTHPALPLALCLQVLLFEPLENEPAHAALAVGQRAELWREALPRIEAAGQMPALMAVLSVDEHKALLGFVAKSPPAKGRATAAVQARRAEADASVSPRNEASAASSARASLVPRLPFEQPIDDEGSADTPARPSGETDDSRFLVPARPTPLVADVAAPQLVAEAPAVHGTSTERTAAETKPTQHPAEPAPSAVAEFDGALDTAWAGLWFLLPLLLRQGLSQQPQPARLFAAILQLAVEHHRLDATARSWVEQVAHHADLDEAAMSALRPAAAGAWRHARVICVREARLPLRRVLHRPGRVWLAPHRVDLTLPLQHVDVRIRRAGFDIDPGFVPWLDSVIRFHYL
ncbi:hypothetical protein [Piscinibacter sakaiensis]|uniref:hypothetical protein n=1 Tax=Piscinibacter sakaiensis TaxID=1547922 RepID=UPI003AAD72AF